MDPQARKRAMLYPVQGKLGLELLPQSHPSHPSSPPSIYISFRLNESLTRDSEHPFDESNHASWYVVIYPSLSCLTCLKSVGTSHGRSIKITVAQQHHIAHRSWPGHYAGPSPSLSLLALSIPASHHPTMSPRFKPSTATHAQGLPKGSTRPCTLSHQKNVWYLCAGWACIPTNSFSDRH